MQDKPNNTRNATDTTAVDTTTNLDCCAQSKQTNAKTFANRNHKANSIAQATTAVYHSKQSKKTPHTAQATKRKRHDKHPQHCQATRHACNKATNCNKRPKMFPLQQTAHQTEQLLQMHCAPQQPQQKNDGEKFAVVFVCTTCFCNKAQGPSRQNSFGCIPTSRDIACRYRANGIEQIPKFG